MMQSPSPRTKSEIIFALSPSQCTDHEFGFVFFPSEIKSSYFSYQKDLFLRLIHSCLNETKVKVDSVQPI